ncbi:BTB domain-containing protein [Trichonephila inaurata madagascariensis]|uniref:BTB domain-containing protein n=1 Tax=Trichonephila inaurata madagascariensis TaxID=2747483 RepID=A0A8X6I9G9_9ARAC|nr:BTB domain-containing protein [Trichonephila inaurata madagascariensis]
MKPTLSPLALDKSHHARLGQYAANLWKDKVLTDVIIIVQNHEFKTHKAVLACYSPYFADAFVRPGFSDVHYSSYTTAIPRYKMVSTRPVDLTLEKFIMRFIQSRKPKNTGDFIINADDTKCTELQLPTVTPRAFAILLEYMYTGQLKVTCQELSDVYRSARKLGMKGAMKECVEPDANGVYNYRVSATSLIINVPSGLVINEMAVLMFSGLHCAGLKVCYGFEARD